MSIRTHFANFSDEERISWLRLIRCENVGPKTFYQLLEIYGSAEKAIRAIPDMSRRGGKKRSIRLCSKEDAEREIENCEAIGAKIITRRDEDYPLRLAFISDAPPVITVLGNPELLSKNSISIVGARNASSNGCRITYGISRELSQKNYTVVSGLARGIDTAAHKGALCQDAGNGGTIAVIASGIDKLYPPENKELSRAIAKNGAIIAECPFGTIPRAENFPQRNRIIAGLSFGTAIIEAATRSGSLITARLATEYGREVMAIPGFPMDPRTEGTNRLLKQGATLVENASDIINAVCYNKERHTSIMMEENPDEFLTTTSKPVTEDQLSELRKILSEKLNASPILVDDLIAECRCNVSLISIVLLELELAGRLERHPGNKVSIIPEALCNNAIYSTFN